MLAVQLVDLFPQPNDGLVELSDLLPTVVVAIGFLSLHFERCLVDGSLVEPALVHHALLEGLESHLVAQTARKSNAVWPGVQRRGREGPLVVFLHRGKESGERSVFGLDG